MKRTKHPKLTTEQLGLKLLSNMFQALAVIADQQRQIVELKKEIAEKTKKENAKQKFELLNLSFLDMESSDPGSSTSNDKIDQV